MGFLTGLLYAVLVAYCAGWYAGRWNGNFSLLLLILTSVTFLYWLAERFVFAPRRRAAATRYEAEVQARRADLQGQGITRIDDAPTDTRERLLMQPWWLDWTAGLFPVILAVFLLRSFVFEPFKIPSGSMVPTLLVGDLILVNKFHYGIRLPVLNRKIVANHDPQRGDVMVFRFPRDPSIDYIKRVVGIPGDEIRFAGQKLYVNGQEQRLDPSPPPGYYDEDARTYVPEFTEHLGAVPHRILVNPQNDRFRWSAPPQSFPMQENCRYSDAGMTCKVPAGHYFMMGDNRDNSEDSRFWGFVPDQNIVGKAFLIWMNFRDPTRVGFFH